MKPLRQARVASKATLLLGAAAQESFRTALKAVELEAERIEHAFLYRWAEGRWPPGPPPTGASAAENAEVLLVANCGADFAAAARPLTERLAAAAQE